MGACGKHYPTMSTEEICALPVREICAPKAALFLWTTGPKFAEALQVMKAWGFYYRNVAFVWVKTRQDGVVIGAQGPPATAVKQNCEYVLFGSTCKRGRPVPIQDFAVPQVILAPRGRHSEKPREVHRRIERLYGDVSRIELFAREQAPGWDCWGDELDNRSAA